MFKAAVWTATLATLTLSNVAQADVHIKLGTRERVSQLFAYPNNCSVICFRDWTLEQTAEHYLTQSVQRDGYTGVVSVKSDNDVLYANISGVPDNYGKPLTDLLNAGELAHSGAMKLNADKKWQYNWYLFLPLGMALENRKSVELLHFPPDTSLTLAQDYLVSATTDRWATLLTLNGIPAGQTPGYQTIIDIAPIAAPANAGSSLEAVYGYFQDYQTTMVKELSQNAAGNALPMVAFGAPVRKWINQQYGVNVSVLGLASISPSPGQKVAVLGSNHPSYIWYADDKSNYGGDQAKADAAGLAVMGQDLSAACWQATMGQTPTADPAATLSACMQKWQVTDKVKTCELFYTAERDLTAEQAAAKCSTGDVTRSLQQLQKPLTAPAIHPFL
ncbi:hypothetical protein [Pseudomonas sp. DWP3-1-2]|uniref:hypothetical protein n=1 Tax=Pseudomonas sp. DWP3-1-2 TaxID=2804645 RepID=UPI003CE7C3AD